MGRQRRYFALKLPIAVDSRNAIFAYADPGHDTDSELRSWGAAHQGLWSALKRQGLAVHVLSLTRDSSTASHFETVLNGWANAPSAANDPAVQQEIDEIQNALSPPDFSVLNRYGGFNEAGRRCAELIRWTRRSESREARIDSYSTWQSPRLAPDDFTL